MFLFFFFFFFQAEDGIRDFHVTGVQTCALPISLVEKGQLELVDLVFSLRPEIDVSEGRSEERRVGKSVDLGGRRIIKKKKKKKKNKKTKKKIKSRNRKTKKK